MQKRHFFGKDYPSPKYSIKCSGPLLMLRLPLVLLIARSQFFYEHVHVFAAVSPDSPSFASTELDTR